MKAAAAVYIRRREKEVAEIEEEKLGEFDKSLEVYFYQTIINLTAE